MQLIKLFLDKEVYKISTECLYSYTSVKNLYDVLFEIKQDRAETLSILQSSIKNLSMAGINIYSYINFLLQFSPKNI